MYFIKEGKGEGILIISVDMLKMNDLYIFDIK